MHSESFDNLGQINPELFHSAYNNSINTLQMERVIKNVHEIMKDQEIILQREDTLEFTVGSIIEENVSLFLLMALNRWKAVLSYI